MAFPMGPPPCASPLAPFVPAGTPECASAGDPTLYMCFPSWASMPCGAADRRSMYRFGGSRDGTYYIAAFGVAGDPTFQPLRKRRKQESSLRLSMHARCCLLKSMPPRQKQIWPRDPEGRLDHLGERHDVGCVRDPEHLVVGLIIPPPVSL